MKAHKKWAEIEENPPMFELTMTISSSDTYVRSIVRDLAIAEGSAAQVVSLTPTRQGPSVSPSYSPPYTARARKGVTWPVGDARKRSTV